MSSLSSNKCSGSLSPLPRSRRPGQSRTGLAGASVDLAYTLGNTGNGTDTYSLIAIVGPATGSQLSVVGDANCTVAVMPARPS